MINNVLSMARIGREQMELNLETVSVEDCYSFICKRIEPQLANSGFELRSVARGDLAKEVSIDRDALMQVFLNLIDNSLKFARDFEPKLIDFSAFVEGNEVVFSVRDHGPGISQVNENKVFDLFYRQENELTRSTTGTGIGLALVKQLSVLMKGQVAYESARPGARFTLRFQLS